MSAVSPDCEMVTNSEFLRHHRIAVAVFAGDFHGARQLADLLDEVARDHAGVIAGAAGDDVHVLGALEDLGGGGAERGLQQPAVGHAFGQRVGHGARLLVDFLEHEVAVLALLGRIRRQLALADRALGGVAVLVEHLDRGAADVGDVAFFEEHEPAGHGQQRGDVRGHEVFVDAQTDDHGTTFARQDDALGLGFADYRQRVGALELGHGGAHGLEEIFLRGEMEVHAVRDHFGVGFGGEGVAGLLELFAQLFVVLDDAVVNDREAAERDVRMRVALGRDAVRGPARVRDADLAVRGVGFDRVLEHLDLADGAQALELGGAVEHGDAGGVVAAVFEAAQPLHQDRDDVALSDGSDDAAHLKVSGGIQGGASLPECAGGTQ